MTQSDDRIIGVDIAKIVAMLLVVAVHINSYGLPYVGNNPPGLFYLLLRSFLGAIFMACIDIFAMASGYVGIMSSFKLSRIIRLWIQVVFTGLTVLVSLNVFTNVKVQPIHYLNACVPIAKNEYWYMTAYFMLAFVMPVINMGIRSLDEKGLRRVVLLMLGIICGQCFILNFGGLGVANGYSFEWLLVLYLVGAYIRLYNPLCMTNTMLFACIVVCAVISGWGPLLLRNGVVHLPRELGFRDYTSPFTVVIALCIFVLCLKIQIAPKRTRRLVGILSSTTLGVYLIHGQTVFFRDLFGMYVHKVTVFHGGVFMLTYHPDM